MFVVVFDLSIPVSKSSGLINIDISLQLYFIFGKKKKPVHGDHGDVL